MNRQVVYLMSGSPHLPYLVASLYTLRQHWQGAVAVYAWPESYDIARRIANDDRLRIDAYKREPTYRGKNSQFLHKIQLMQSLAGTVDMATYLDADSTIHGPIDRLFDLVDRFGFVITQFNDWYSNSGQPRNRVSRLVGREPIDQTAVQDALTKRYPSPNGGVFACRPTSPVLPLWEAWTWAVRDIFIADETVLHAIYAEFVRRAEESVQIVAIHGAYNSSPKFQHLPDDQVVIRHYHGDSNCRPNKCQRGVDLWMPIYRECLRYNIGGVAEWAAGCGNKYLNALEVQAC